jgi:circadian clock protein KaiB
MTKSRKPTGAQHPRAAGAAHAEGVLRLYVNDLTPRSQTAIANIRAVCAAQLRGQYHLAIIDIGRHPRVAKTEQIVALPTLLRKWPLPEKRIIGDLSNREKVLGALDLTVGVG